MVSGCQSETMWVRTPLLAQNQNNVCFFESFFVYYNMIIKCENCEKDFERVASEVKRSVHHFCSKKCAAETNNKKFPKRVKNSRNCLYCNNQIDRGKFCSNKHHKLYYRKQYIERWLAGKETGCIGKTGSISYYIKHYLLDKYKNSCSQCGWSKKHPDTKRYPLQVHHKDGNCLNNELINLELLCPNCHSLTTTYGRSNSIGNGRRLRGLRT
jgi:hypothetical protein